ncbi:MAG: hypothetical protein U0K57_08935 [Lachnospiraceae bacterium]|nr:hypothetical protein [Lachnospiraceae bacterium]
MKTSCCCVGGGADFRIRAGEKGVKALKDNEAFIDGFHIFKTVSAEKAYAGG